MHHDPNCIFCKIAQGQIPSRKVHEDEEIVVFHDINPWAPVHFLMVPKEHIPSMAQVEERHVPLLGRMMALAPQLALKEGCRPYPEGGFRIAVNTHRGQHRRGRRPGSAPPPHPCFRWAAPVEAGLSEG